MSDDKMVIRHGATVWRRVRDETVVLDLEHEAYLALNSSASALWDAMSDGASHEDLIQTLVEQFRVDPATANTDVKSFLRECRTRGLIEAR